MDKDASMKPGGFCFFLLAVFLIGGVDGGNVDECSADMIKDIDDQSEQLFSLLKATKVSFKALDDFFSKLCENLIYKSLVSGFMNKLSKCPDIIGKTKLVTMNYGPIAFVDGFEKELSKGIDYFCGCSPYIMSGLVINGLRRKSAFVLEDYGMFQFTANISAFCAEINDETMGEISIPSAVRKVFQGREICPEVLRLAGLNSSKTQSILTDFIEQCDTYNPADFQCALEKSSLEDFTKCVAWYVGRFDPCRKARCVKRKIGGLCGGRSEEYYITAVNLLNDREGFNRSGCEEWAGTKKSKRSTQRDVNYNSNVISTPPSATSNSVTSCPTDEKVAKMNNKIEDMFQTYSHIIKGFKGLNGLLSASCELVPGEIKKFADMLQKCPDLTGRIDLTNVKFGFLKFGSDVQKLATKGYQYFCDCAPYLLSSLVLNGLKDLQNINHATGVFPTIANISFYCDEIHDEKTVLSGAGKCPEMLPLAGIKSNNAEPDVSRVLDQCSKYKPDEFACTLDSKAMDMVKGCNDSWGDELNTCSFYDCVVANMTKKCGCNGAENYVSAVNLVFGHQTLNVDGCKPPCELSSSSIQLNTNDFLILYVMTALKILY